MIERGQYKNFIEVFNELSYAIVMTNDIKTRSEKVLLLYDLIRGYLTEENKRKGDRLYYEIENGGRSIKASRELFRLIQEDKNIMKLKNFHAGYADLKSYDLTPSAESPIPKEK